MQDDWSKLGAEIGISLENDAADEERVQQGHASALESMIVPNDGLDPAARKMIQEYRARNGHQPVDDHTWLAKTLDVPAQAVNGLVDAVAAMKDLTFDVAGAGARTLYVDAMGIATNAEVNAEVDKLRGATSANTIADTVAPGVRGSVDLAQPFGAPKSAVGGMTESVSQFLAPFAALGKVKYLQQLGKVAPLAKGALADFVAFDEHEARLSNVINEMGWGGAVTEYLAADPNDTWAEGRFKNVLEGAGLGAMTDGFFKGVKYIRDGQKAKQFVAEVRAKAGPRAQEIRAAATEVGGIRTWISGTLKGEKVELPVAPAAKDVNPTTVIASADRDTAIRTIFGEASNQGEEGWQAVANVLLNRRQTGRWGDSLDKVAKAKNQFEPWGNKEARARMEALDINSPEYKAIGEVFDRVAKGDLPDNTGGATHFLQRQLQESLGRKVPKWAKDALGKVGDHEFFAPDGGPVTGRVAMSAQAPAGAETMAGFRPNREQMDLATQRRLAAANGTTEEMLKDGGVFKRIRDAGIQDQLNKVTLLEEQQFGITSEALQGYMARANAGDLAAADEFWRNEGAAFLEVAGHARDAFQDVARAQGLRGNSAAIVTTNQLLQRLSRATTESKEDLMRAFAEMSRPEQMESLLQQAGRKTAMDVTREAVHEWYINAILSSPKTQLVDTAGTLVWTPWLALEKIPAGIVGKIRAGWLGGASDRVMADEALVMLKSYMGSISDGFSFVAHALKGGDMGAIRQGVRDMRLDTASRFDDDVTQRAISADNFGLERESGFGRMVDWAGSVINLPASFMRSKDDVAKAVLYRAEVRALAHRKAVSEGLTGPAYDARINELMSVPMDKVALKEQSLNGNRLAQIASGLAKGDDTGLVGTAIEEQAKTFAREGTFTDELGEVGKSMQSLLNRIPGGRVVVPFIKTPTKIMVRFLERTPLAPVLFKKVRDEIAAGGARADMALGRMAAGSSVMTLGWYLASAGLITGEGPKDTAQREALLRTGWRPRSIKVGDKYIEYGRLDPLASFLSMPANIVDLADQFDDDMGGDLERDVSDYVSMGILGFTNMMMSKTWTQSIAELVDAVNRQDENAVERMMQYYAASAVVPNAVTFFANEVNPIVQEANTAWEAIQIKAGKTVRPKLDVFGEVVKRDPQLYYGLPASYANITTDPLSQELAASGVFIERPSRRIDGVELTRDEYSAVLQEMKALGIKDAIRKVVASPVWATLPDVEKTGVEGAQNMTKSGVIGNLYREFTKAAREITVSKNATLQERILRYNQALQTTSPATPNVRRALDAQGFSASPGAVRVDFGLGRNP